MTTLEASARNERFDTLYLDTHDSFGTTIALYGRRGYEQIPATARTPRHNLHAPPPVKSFGTRATVISSLQWHHALQSQDAEHRAGRSCVHNVVAARSLK